MPSFTDEVAACRSIVVADGYVIGAGNDRVIRSWPYDSNRTKVISSPWLDTEVSYEHKEVDVTVKSGLVSKVNSKVKVVTESLKGSRPNVEAH